MTARSIFLSYSNSDRQIAKHLASKLEIAGVSCFMAEKAIRAGEQWEQKIRDAIIEADTIILLITPRSKNSRWVATEAGAAWVLNKTLIAALMFVEVTDLIQPIRRHQARPVETPEQIEALVNELAPLVLGSPTLSGQWMNPYDNDSVFFKQVDERVVGIYDYGSQSKKVGVYQGTFADGIFYYEWKWLRGPFMGAGRMTLSNDGKRLVGEWWYGDRRKETEEVEYRRVSQKMPPWLQEEDFQEYEEYLRNK